jgi:DNA-binding NtrC family response regulator
MPLAISRIDLASPKLKALLDAYERQLIQSALIATAGNQRRAAQSLGLLPTTLHEKMKRLGLVRRPARAADSEAEMRGPEPEEMGRA